ncbi:MAG: hypothetical protein K2H89_02060 [Oscillospiraceae bacterium]|nr:hypothetical protein [Oscillospiraceae bacterium]
MKEKKKNRSPLIVLLSISVLLTGCGFQEIENPESDSQIHIATIPQQAEHAAPKPAPTTETKSETENFSETAIENKERPELETEAESETEPEIAPYSDYDFEKAVFAALLDGLCSNTDSPTFVMADVDRDHYAEFMISIPVSETSSQNIVLESAVSAGVYYYDATGIQNDFFVIDPEQNQVFLNENTCSEEGNIISREYFEWQSNQWETVSLLYGNHCYWNNANVSTDEFYTNAEKLIDVFQPEDVFNIYLSAEMKEVTDAFYQYLSKYYKPSKPITADINGDGMSEQIIFVQNLSKNWIGNVHNLYETDGVLDTTGLSAMHTTCFVLDYVGESVRIRSENFDRKYQFEESGGMLWAYSDTNATQTIQYTDSLDGLGKHFMSVMWG